MQQEPIGNGGAGGDGNGGGGSGGGGGGGAPSGTAAKVSKERLRRVGIVGRLVANFTVTTNAGTPISFPRYRVPVGAKIEVRPIPSNTNDVFISRNPLVTADSMRKRFSATETPVELEAEILSEWNLDVTTNGEGVEIAVKVS